VVTRTCVACSPARRATVDGVGVSQRHHHWHYTSLRLPVHVQTLAARSSVAQTACTAGTGSGPEGCGRTNLACGTTLGGRSPPRYTRSIAVSCRRPPPPGRCASLHRRYLMHWRIPLAAGRAKRSARREPGAQSDLRAGSG